MNDMIVCFSTYLILLSISMLFVNTTRLVFCKKTMFYFINGAIVIAIFLSLWYPQFALTYAIIGGFLFGMDLFLFLKYRNRRHLITTKRMMLSGIFGFIYSTCLFANIMIGISALAAALVG